ncbi:hypothetical protein BJ912DRAFT_1013481 [Pholiota molesta]|nr:hypothetical protein BJ912DRAFT_1013481 [Pholiota molesta]
MSSTPKIESNRMRSGFPPHGIDDSSVLFAFYLERALSLFIQVLVNHEIDADLRTSTITRARLIDARTNFRAGVDMNVEEITAIHKNYQGIVRTYGKEFKSLWKGKPISDNANNTEFAWETSAAGPPPPDKANKTIRKIQSVVAALSKARIAGKSGTSNAARAASEVSSEVSGEGPGAASDVENDFFTFETTLADEIQSNNPGVGESSGATQTTAEEVNRPPRGSAEWPKRHRVQLSHAGQFRLIHGRSEMAARRDSYNEEEDVSPEPSVRRPESSAANVDAASSTSSLNLGDRNYYYARPRGSIGNASELTGSGMCLPLTVACSDINIGER